MEVKKIVEGMTAPQVAQVIDDNFKAQNAILEEDIAKQNNVIGVSEYKDFSEAEAVNAGDVRKYNGFLCECVEATTGAFDASKWKKSSFKAETEKKISDIEEKTDAKLAELEFYGGIDVSHWGIAVSEIDKREGYINLDGTFEYRNTYITKLYNLEDITKGVVSIQEFGNGFYSFGICDVNYNLIKPFRECNSPSDRRNILFSIILDKSENLLFITSRIDADADAKFYNKYSGYRKIKEIEGITDRLFGDSYATKTISYFGYMPNEYDSWQDNYNYETHFYEINRLVDYKIIGQDYGAGLPSYGFATNTSKEKSSIISYVPMESIEGATDVNISIEKNEIPLNANYIFVVSRLGLPKSLYEDGGFIPESNRKRIENLEQNKITSYFRARVINYTDTVLDGSEYTDNNVNRTFKLLQVIRKYNSTHDIMICIGLNGPNGMFGLRGWRLIENSSNSLAEFPLDTSFTEMGETIGPWQIQSVNNSIEDSGQYFVGGFHGLINPYTNKHYPSAKNLEYKFYADNREISLGEEVLCYSIKATSSVNICSNNTFNKESNTAREVLNYKDTYQMFGDKIYVFAKFTALEDITINLHYGLQTDKFNPIIGYLNESGLYETNTNIDYEYKNIYSLPSLIYAKRNDGNTLFCKMYNKGAMTGERTDNIKAFHVSYGAGNTKTHHWVYGNGKIGNLKTGDTNYYCGWFSISDKDLADIE